MSKLTVLQLRSLKSKEKAYTIADGGGLSAHVAPTGIISWRYRYRFHGKPTTIVLGKYPEVSLADARKLHQNARLLLADGINPTAKRKEDKLGETERGQDDSANSFRSIAEEWIEHMSDSWSANHCKAVGDTLKHDAYPILGDLRIDTITPPQILQVIRQIESRGSYEIASKVLQRITAVCRYAVQTGRAIYNPAADMRGVLKTRRVEHRAALSAHEMPEFLNTLNSSNEHVITKAALLFTILTAARSGEVRFARWPEVDFDNRVWRIPANRMKMRTPHNVPLSNHALKILEAMKAHKTDDDGFVFPGIKTPEKPLSENTLLYALYRLGYHSRATVHGFRAVFSTIANEKGTFDKDAIERQLAHQERNRVRAAYHRSEYLEQRREIMEWWGGLVCEMLNGAGVSCK